MKKTLTFVLATIMVCSCAFVGCKGKNNSTPKSYVDGFYGALKNKEYDKVVDMMPGTDTLSKENRDNAISMMSLFEVLTGGLEDYEILSEDISADGKTAVVKVKVTYNNGKVDTDECQLEKTDKGWVVIAPDDETESMDDFDLSMIEDEPSIEELDEDMAE